MGRPINIAADERSEPAASEVRAATSVRISEQTGGLLRSGRTGRLSGLGPVSPSRVLLLCDDLRPPLIPFQQWSLRREFRNFLVDKVPAASEACDLNLRDFRLNPVSYLDHQIRIAQSHNQEPGHRTAEEFNLRVPHRVIQPATMKQHDRGAVPTYLEIKRSGLNGNAARVGDEGLALPVGDLE